MFAGSEECQDLLRQVIALRVDQDDLDDLKTQKDPLERYLVLFYSMLYINQRSSFRGIRIR